MVQGKFGGFSEGHDRGDILGAAAPSLFLASAQQRRVAGPLVDVESADSLRCVELVGREGDILDIQPGEIDRHLPRGLHGVEMERNLLLQRDGGDLLDGEEHPGLVIPPEQGDDGGL